MDLQNIGQDEINKFRFLAIYRLGKFSIYLFPNQNKIKCR